MKDKFRERPVEPDTRNLNDALKVARMERAFKETPAVLSERNQRMAFELIK